MTNSELERIFRINSSLSVADGLRGVFNAGYAAGAGLSAPAVGDPSQAQTFSTALTLTPTIKTRTKD
jgi:hypothetical protein